MGYIEQTLGTNEPLLYKARFPWLYHTFGWGTLLVFLTAASAVYSRDIAWLAGLIAVIGMLVFLAIMIPIWTTEIGVTNHRLIFKRGWLNRKTSELQLRSTEEVVLNQNIFGRLFNFGRIEVRGTGVDDVRLPVLADPIGLRKALQDAIGSAAPLATGSAAGPAPTT